MSSEEQEALNCLIDRARRGDREATAELLMRYQGLVHATHVRILGPRVESLDLLQETFARALVSLSQLSELRGFSNWLQRIATNVAIDYLRKNSRNSWLTLMPPESLPEVTVDALDEGELQRVQRIYALLEQLPLEDRAAFSLRWLAEHELTEVAEICGCSLATAKRRIKRGHERFSALARRDPVLSERWGRDLQKEII